MRRLWLIVPLAFLAGCGGGGDGDQKPAPPGKAGAGDKVVIEGWVDALNGRDYDRAADYFADGAIVEQDREFRLKDHAQAVVFNKSLPCKARLTSVADEGTTTLGAFALSGADPSCSATVRVRFLVVDGKFRQWRQQQPVPAPQGETA